jgi:hypothetical protein
MARERTLVEAWMGTSEGVDFVPTIYETNIFSARREGASEGTVPHPPPSAVRDKNRDY